VDEAQDTGEAGTRGGAGSIWSPIVFVLACAWLGWRTLSRLLAVWPFVTDDAWITLRYARHLLAGEGLVWNLGGARVEGYSNFAFVLLAAGYGALGELDPAPLKVLCCAAVFATGYLQWAIARRFVGPLPALLPFAFWSLQRGVYWWAASGLETMVHVAVCCGAALASLRGLGFERVELGPGELIGRARGSVRPRALAVAGGLCVLDALLRPEGPLLAAAIGLAALASLVLDRRAAPERFDAPGHRRAALVFVMVFVPLMLAYAGWRLAYFGELVPNTVRCKTGHGDRFALLEDYWSAASLSLVLAAIWPLRSLDARVLLPWALAAVYGLALLGADPLIGHQLRHVLAVHALICVLAAVAALRLAAWVGAGLVEARAANARVVEVALVLLVLAAAKPLGDLPERKDLHSEAKRYGARTRTRAALGEHLARELEPGELALVGDVGVAGFRGDAAILDSFCLNSRELARPPLRGDAKRQAAWILDEQRPQIIVVHTRSKQDLEPRGAIYRELLKRDRFREGWREGRRFNSKYGAFHYLVFHRREPGDPPGDR
jgi:hypothetical protein